MNTLRIANCSGFYGDRLSAAREMVEGGPIDVLTGDWLAELTMLILAGNQLKGRPGYAPTFLTQLEQVLGRCQERGIKIVSNAGGLDPAGCAQAVADLATRLGIHGLRIAHVTGDDVRELAGEGAVTANAYLGGRPIAAALAAGADVVVTGRVTDAALVTGPGMWRHGWGPGDLDALAGSVVAGHIIECGCQATGGNYAFFEEVPDLAGCGFPIAELRPDGSSVITKHPGTGGLVSVGTVTAQLLYEIASPRYLGPDVTARFDTIRLTQIGPNRVLVTGVTGEPPPETLKVAVNRLGGYRNTMTLVLTGLDLAAKAQLAEEAIWARVPKESFEQAHMDLTPLDGETALLRITVMDPDRKRAGRAFSSAVVETGLASYPGLYGLTPPGDATAYGVYTPSSIARDKVHVQVWLDGREIPIPPDDLPRPLPLPAAPASGLPYGTHVGPWTTAGLPLPADVTEETVPLGRIAGARSGDKGGDANLGVWVRTPEEYAWLSGYLTVERLRELLPEVRDRPIERFVLPNLLALNFLVYGLLGQGVAASPRLDPQAKALGERLRAVRVPLPSL
ncbi:acyclic terpene utilization AtuA family protein [Acrocarpospora sp. B8E8]|uniref:acyclic terpene utilization AtuA family protein n=1 Tax=Acrocarpospora sp. B8E8 TaxID=3153572 RepID=UPI00325EA871